MLVAPCPRRPRPRHSSSFDPSLLEKRYIMILCSVIYICILSILGPSDADARRHPHHRRDPRAQALFSLALPPSVCCRGIYYFLHCSDKTLDEQRKFESLLKDREIQRTMREIAVPTQVRPCRHSSLHSPQIESNCILLGCCCQAAPYRVE